VVFFWLWSRNLTGMLVKTIAKDHTKLSPEEIRPIGPVLS
jgi:hypothetical protein